MLRILMLFFVLVPAGLQAGEAPDSVDGALTVNIAQARQLHELGAIFVDVRPEREWAWGHIQGALHLDLATRFQSLAISLRRSAATLAESTIRSLQPLAAR